MEAMKKSLMLVGILSELSEFLFYFYGIPLYSSLARAYLKLTRKV